MKKLILAVFVLLFGIAAGNAQQSGNKGQASANSNPDYVIGSGDVLNVSVWKEPELTRVVVVRPDGRISLPLIGDVEVAGKSSSKLQEELTSSFTKYVSAPTVSVVVQEIHSQEFSVLGEVQRPGVYPLPKPVTVLEALAVAGGFRDFAKMDHIFILRNNEGKQERIAVNYKKVISGKQENYRLQPRDMVVVP